MDRKQNISVSGTTNRIMEIRNGKGIKTIGII